MNQLTLTWNEMLAVHRAMKHYADKLANQQKRGPKTQARQIALKSAWRKIFPHQIRKSSATKPVWS
jgi:hypothetical protein